MSAFTQDLRYALRQLRRNPGFAAVVILTLTLGIGANTAVFSVLHGVLLRPLPYAEPDELVAIWTRYLPSTGQDIPQFPVSAPEIVDYRDASRALEDVIPHRWSDRTLTGEGQDPVRVRVGFVGAGLLSLLGAGPALGRTFVEEEEAPGASRTVLLSHVLWRERFGGDPEVVGRTVELDGEAARVVGVMPEDFVFPDASVRLWTPLGWNETDLPSRGNHYLQAIGRLAPGVGLERAEAELEAIMGAWSEEYEHYAMGHFLFLRPLHEDLVGDVGPVLWLLMTAVLLVLLVACANVANLFLARSQTRTRETAVRAALGAGRGRLIRQLLTESGVLAALGAVGGLALAAWGTGALARIDPGAIPRLEAVRLDATVLFFTGALAVATALAFGLVPAFRAARSGLAAAARSHVRAGGDAGGRRFRSALVAAEVTVSVVVVVAAGLLVRSFQELSAVDPGIEPRGVLTFDLSLPSAEYPASEQAPAFFERLLERIRGLPGVRSAASISVLPLTGAPPRVDFQVEGEPAPPGGIPAWNADVLYVQPGYFETMRIPLLRGRTFEAADRADRHLVAVVNRAAVRRYWPDEDPIGVRFTYDAGAEPIAWITIVGVVADTKVDGLDAETRPQVFLPHDQLRVAQGSPGRYQSVVVRTEGDPLALAPAVRGVVRELDPGLALANLRTADDVVEASVARPRLTAELLASFGFLALLLSAIGIYGVVGYSVARRSREIGIRMALGADRRRVLRLVLRQGMGPVAAGALAGLAAALAATRLLSSLLFGVSPADPAVFASVVVLLAAVGLLACWLPARRALRVDPATTLRYE